jgi:hypothetical protein
MRPRRRFVLLLAAVAVLAIAPVAARAATLIGTPGNDVINGTPGDDTIFGLDGNDVINGGAGNDDIDGGGGSDDIHGGPGIDAVLYGDRTGPVKVTLDNVRNDGQGGDDNVHSDIEQIYGGMAGDQLVGDDQPNLIDGGPGNDTIVGGGGADRLYGGPGNDTINSFDGTADIVNCGPGTDTVMADPDDVLIGCERRKQPPRVRSIVDFGFTFRGALTTVDRLTVRSIPAGGAVVVACRGGGCPFATKATKLKQGQKREALAGLFKGRSLRAGATLDVRVTATGLVGRVHRFQMRRNKEPSDSVLCLMPGSKRATKC